MMKVSANGPTNGPNGSPAWFYAWLGVLFSHGSAIREIENYLVAEHDLPLTWFDILSRLSGAPGNQMRMSELSDAALFTRSGITRLVDRIEAAEFVRREPIPGDRRGVNVVLTSLGSDKFKEAFEGHMTAIEESFASKLSPKQWSDVADALAGFLDKTKQD